MGALDVIDSATCIYVPFHDGAQAVAADQLVATVFNIAIAVISVVSLLFYAYHARSMTCGWEEVYVVCVEREWATRGGGAGGGGFKAWGCSVEVPALLLRPSSHLCCCSTWHRPAAVIKVMLEIFFEACPPVTLIAPDGVSHIVWIR